MKKLFYALIATGLISTSLMAAEGSVDFIKADGTNGDITLAVLDTASASVKAKKLVGTTDAIKAMLAISLTAKSTQTEIIANVGTIDTVTGWTKVTIK